MDSSAVKEIKASCVFDLCTYKSQPSLQQQFKCGAFEMMNIKCLALAQTLGMSWEFQWRDAANCSNFNFIK